MNNAEGSNIHTTDQWHVWDFDSGGILKNKLPKTTYCFHMFTYEYSPNAIVNFIERSVDLSCVSGGVSAAKH
jgi:hypothetical protein